MLLRQEQIQDLFLFFKGIVTEEFTGFAKATVDAQQTSSETEDRPLEPLTSLFNPASTRFSNTELTNKCELWYQMYNGAYT